MRRVTRVTVYERVCDWVVWLVIPYHPVLRHYRRHHPPLDGDLVHQKSSCCSKGGEGNMMVSEGRGEGRVC